MNKINIGQNNKKVNLLVSVNPHTLLIIFKIQKQV